MELDKIFKINFRVGAQPPDHNDFCAFMRIVVEGLLTGSPQAIVTRMLPVKSSNSVWITETGRDRFALAQNGNFLSAQLPQAAGHALDQRLPQHVKQAQSPASKALRLVAADNENGSYIHA